jgi:Outer membrane protein beta-barrel domain
VKGAIAVFTIVGAILPSAALAQTQAHSSPHAGSIGIDGGVVWSGGYAAGTATANETRNPPTGSSPLQLFKSDARLDSAVGVAAQIGICLTPKWSIEGGVQISRPTLATRLSADAEFAPETTAKETVSQYLFEGSVLYQLGSIAHDRGKPFVSGGAGYIRQLDAGNENLHTGTEFHGGGGLRYWFGNGPRRFSLRVEGRVSVRNDSVDLGSGVTRRVVPAILAGLGFLF